MNKDILELFQHSNSPKQNVLAYTLQVDTTLHEWQSEQGEGYLSDLGDVYDGEMS